MRYLNLPPTQLADNRRRLAERLPGDGFAVVHAADVRWRCSDGSTRFIQDADLFFLTGIDQEETALLLCPGHPDPSMREILFVRETSETIATWEGYKLTREGAAEVSGIEHVRWTTDFEPILRRLARRCRRIHLDHNEHPRADSPLDFSRDDRFRRRCQALHPHHRYERLAPHLQRLRAEKSEPEIDRIRTAVAITAAGFERALRMVEPGVMEYEVEAEFLHEFVRRGSRGFAYEPIVASGANTTVLHYLDNDQPCRDGDLLLIDAGAEYANYNADLTRTLPVDGTFTPRQRAVYEAVLRILRLCIDRFAVPGKHVKREYQPEVARAMEEELIALDLLDAEEVEKEREDEDLPEEKRAYRRYFMHGASHSLGIDVHDVTPRDGVLRENMCITVEPGIYIREEGIGIRLENDIVVREGGNLDLTADVPIEPDDIEAAMADRP